MIDDIIDKIADKVKKKPWILDFAAGTVYYTMAATIMAGVAYYALNNKIDENEISINKNEKSIENFKETVNRKIIEQNDSIIKCYKEIPQIRDDERENRKIMMNMLDQRFEKLEKKTASYNLSFIVNDGNSKKNIKLNKLNNEYMCKLFNNMDTIYNTINEKNNVKINAKWDLYSVSNKLKSMDENDKIKFKSLENYTNSISEVSIERAE